MGDIIKASFDHVDIAAVRVRVLAAARKKGIGKAPCTRCLNGPAGSEWKISDIKAELDL